MGYDTVLAPVNMRWIPLTEKEPEEGFEVLLYNKNWINEDWNPKGVRVGYLDGVGGWISAYWCNYHDDYHTRTSDEDDKQFEDYKAENQIPTHWMEYVRWLIGANGSAMCSLGIKSTALIKLTKMIIK